MSTIVDELVALLGYRVEGKEKLKDFNDGLDETERRARTRAERATEHGRKIGLALTATTAAAATMGTAGFRNFAAFERQMSRIGNTADASADEVVAASDGVQQLARDLALPLEEAVSGLDTLVSTGMNLEEAMSFLPSVLATAQASGSAAADIANTAEKTASALKLPAEEMQRAFDIMVAGGKAGQFELNEMAMFIPTLANQFANLGMDGEEGLQQLIALLQTVREDTGSSGQAATQLSNVFQKMFSNETAKRFEDFGIDLRARMDEARDSGENLLDTFVALSNEAIQGDMTKLPLLFNDKELQLGMQSLMTSQESYLAFLDAVSNSEVDGSVLEDLNTILNDSQANIDRLSANWDRFMKQIGAGASNVLNPTLEFVNEGLSLNDQAMDQMNQEGMGFVRRNFFTTPGQRARAIQRDRDEQMIDALDAATMDSVITHEQPEVPTAASPATASGSPRATAMQRVQGADNRIAIPEADLAQQNTALDAINSRLSQVSPDQAVETTMEDNRQDNRSYRQDNNINITQNITEASDAPAAAAQATGDAVVSAIPEERGTVETGPSF